MFHFGGFVRLLGEEEYIDDEHSFSKASIGKRIAIVVAGAAVNIVFGLILFWILASIYNKSAKNGLFVTKDYVVSIFKALVGLFTRKASNVELIGPVGISNMIIKTNSLFDLFYLLAVISVSLGITNLLPIPALDGGKILILLIELIRRKPIKENTEIVITAIRIFNFNINSTFCYCARHRKIILDIGERYGRRI